MLIQLMYCVPGPMRAPRPNWKAGSSGRSIPPRRDSTMPDRKETTRTPAAAAGCAAVSQSRTRAARKPRPAGAASSTALVPVSPYQPIADADSSTRGGSAAPSMACTRALVLPILLERSSRLRAGVQRPPATGAPDRWTTASSPLSADGLRPPSLASGFQRSSASLDGGRRTSRMISAPSPRRLSASAVPMRPVEPVIATRRGVPSLETELGLERAFLQPLLNREEEPGSVGAVHEPVVIGERQVDHRPYGDDLAEFRVLDDDGALNH